MHQRQFSEGVVDDDGYTVHSARGLIAGSTFDSQGRHFRSSALRRSTGFRTSTRRSVLSQTSEAAAHRGFFLPSGGIGASVFNLSSATLGAGVLALPKCGAYSGWLLTALYVALSGTASCYAIIVLVMVSNQTALMSYEEMSLKILGSRRWVFLSVILIALLCFGTSVGYIIAIGDMLDPFRELNGVPHWLQGQTGRYYSQIAWWLVFFLPVSMPKHVNALRMGSCVGVFAVVFLLSMMSVHLAENDHKPKTEMIRGGVGTLFSLPVIMFGYGCQVNTFEIYKEMYRPSTKRMSLVAIIALFLCSSFYIAAGCIGYIDFGSGVENNVLNDFNPTSNAAAAIAFLGISITVTMAFPLCIFPTRDALQFLIWPPKESELQKELSEATVPPPSDAPPNYNSTDKTRSESAEPHPSDDKGSHISDRDSLLEHDEEEGGMSDNKRRILVFCICLCVLLSGLFIPNITTAFGIIGGLCIGPIGYTIPALFALRSGHWKVANVGRGHVVAVYLLFMYGVICALAGTGVSVYHIVVSND